MLSVSFHLTRSTTKSISAPARKVSSTLPTAARKSIHTVECSSSKLPPAIPTQISINATDIPSRTERSAAIRAIPIQSAARE